MPGPARAGALIYAKNIEKLSGFYQTLFAMTLLKADAEHHVIESADFQLIIHAIPAPIADSISISAPPEPRQDQAIKLFFTVDDLASAEALAPTLGGDVYGPVYDGPGFKVRNGYDPEGNIFQVRAFLPTP
ncbi:MAG: hypothetical protein CTY34_13020 [Methylobacter sp.]|nr:MAG: hypothetical protein CTY34_13020 [Methylobacter sp.]PPD02392.1 MAG: hypothetical protein CTY29_13075 [Methylobacter sp.]